MIAYNYLFRVRAIAFVVAAPLVFLMATPKRVTSGAPAAVAAE
jgi:hypothetical protein